MHAAPPPAITGGGAAFYKRGLRKGSVPSGYFSARAETDLARATCHAVCKWAAGCCGKGAPIFKSALPAASQEAEGQTPLQGASTGVAVILRTAGENRIVLHAGANHALGAEDIASDLRRIGEKNDILVTQGECAPAATEAALREARELGLYTIYNPAPARPAPDALWPCVDLVCLNETECQLMCGLLPSAAGTCRAAADRFFCALAAEKRR